MLEQFLNFEQMIFYLLAVEGFCLMLLQFRTNHLLRRSYKMRMQKKEHTKALKEEIKNGSSDIPVVKFEKEKTAEDGKKKSDKKSGYDPKEMAVLQEMMTQFFG